MGGQGRNAISKLLKISEKAVTKYVKAYNDSGLVENSPLSKAIYNYIDFYSLTCNNSYRTIQEV